MAKNFIGKGETLTLVTPAGGTIAGEGILVGMIFGISQHDAAAGDAVEVCVEGEFDIAKLAALALAQGAAVYWDDVNKEVNATAMAQHEVGYVTVAAVNPSATVRVRLVPTVRSSSAA